VTSPDDADYAELADELVALARVELERRLASDPGTGACFWPADFRSPCAKPARKANPNGRLHGRDLRSYQEHRGIIKIKEEEFARRSTFSFGRRGHARPRNRARGIVGASIAVTQRFRDTSLQRVENFQVGTDAWLRQHDGSGTRRRDFSRVASPGAISGRPACVALRDRERAHLSPAHPRSAADGEACTKAFRKHRRNGSRRIGSGG
jgi:hypothetical protein